MVIRRRSCIFSDDTGCGYKKPDVDDGIIVTIQDGSGSGLRIASEVEAWLKE